jgi:hypothetical protein
MPELSDMIRDYCDILTQERQLADRKEGLRAAIADAMAQQNIDQTRTLHGSARQMSRFKLTPRKEPVLNLLSSEDLFPFARFTPAGVKEILVPKFGRESLIPLFDIQKSRYLLINRTTQSFQR